MTSDRTLQQRIAELEEDVRRLERVNEVLMDRVERSTDTAGSSYSLFESNLLLQNKLREHTSRLVQMNHDLHQQISERKRAEQELRHTHSQLVQSEKMASLGMLVAGIAHEINTPIGAVCSMHNTLMRSVDKLKNLLAENSTQDDPTCKRVQSLMQVMDDANQVIGSGTARVTDIVRRLRTFARLDEAELMETDIHEGMEDTLTLVHNELKHTVTVQRDFGEIPRITCYPGRLNQVFVNLLINAKQAIEGKGTITIVTRLRGEKIHISFTDTGSGIPPDKIDRIFDPGFTTKGVGVGTGLGLSICYQLIQEDHRGEITVESEVGKGTTFTIILPINLKELLRQCCT
jgi:signal transduction histidine kinase